MGESISRVAGRSPRVVAEEEAEYGGGMSCGMYMSTGGEKGDEPRLEVSLSGCQACHDGGWAVEEGTAGG